LQAAPGISQNFARSPWLLIEEQERKPVVIQLNEAQKKPEFEKE